MNPLGDFQRRPELWNLNRGCTLLGVQSMKMLFFSADEMEVTQVSREFCQAGIRCEVRNSPVVPALPQCPHHAELWIKDDRDCHRAFMLCVQLGVGFAKRPTRVIDIDDVDESPEVPEDVPELSRATQE